MPEFIRVQASLPSGTGVPADFATNTFHFSSQSAANAEDAADLAVTALTTFYQAIDNTLFGSTVVTPIRLKAYDMTDPSPRVPIVEDTITITTTAGDCLPTECAICLSYQGDAVSGTSQARRRGRIYLGPLLEAVTTTASGRVVLGAGLVTTITGAATALAGITGPPDIIWSVFSPSTAGPEPWTSGQLEDAFVSVTNGWVDNALDTQRRRGTDPTVRTLWTN